MYTHLIHTMKSFPAAYEPGKIAFWNDEHISKSMLDAHLAADSDGASRKHDFIQKSAEWIGSLPTAGNRLLDLGCGPGLYAQRLHDQGYRVTGMDFSKRSIAYARQSAENAGKSIDYLYQDYLTMDYQQAFDVAMMIYCDFGVLPLDDRKLLLEKTYTALKPGGLFIVDVFTPKQYGNFTDTMTAEFDNGGFWRPDPYLCIKRQKQYAGNVFLEQYTILTESGHAIYNLWNHAFVQSELSHDLNHAGFSHIEFYGDAAGAPLSDECPTICAVAKKP